MKEWFAEKDGIQNPLVLRQAVFLVAYTARFRSFAASENLFRDHFPGSKLAPTPYDVYTKYKNMVYQRS